MGGYENEERNLDGMRRRDGSRDKWRKYEKERELKQKIIN